MKKDNKKADYTDIKNRWERSSRFKMMFYVIGFEIQRRVLSQCLLLPTEPKAVGVVQYFRCTNTVSGNPDHFLNQMNKALYSVVGCGWIFHTIIIQNPTPKVNPCCHDFDVVKYRKFHFQTNWHEVKRSNTAVSKRIETAVLFPLSIRNQ